MKECTTIETGASPMCAPLAGEARDASIMVHLLLAFGAAWAVRSVWRRVRPDRAPLPRRAGGGA